MAANDEDIKIIPGTEFVVDGFKFKKKYNTFFLTHFHSDHYAGLIKTWSHGEIFCTIPTCNLVKRQFQIPDRYLHPCEFNITYEHEGVRFTFLDANHCPGSSLILFQVLKTEKAYLHTGDMRFDRSKMLDCEELRPYMRDDIRKIAEEKFPSTVDIQPKKQLCLESIFIDTTYCDPFYTFPKQTEAIEFISELLSMKLNNSSSKKYLILIGTYLIGKERIAEGISKRTGKKIFVTYDKYKTLECLELPYMNIFTMDISATNIHIVNMKDIGWKRLFEIRASNRNIDEIIAIKPSAWCFKDMDIPKTMPLDGSIPEVPVKANRSSNITLIEVPYSEHSSFTELKECVQTFNYNKLVPTVYTDADHKSRIIEMLSDDFVYNPITVKFTIPEVVLTEQAVKSSTPYKKRNTKTKTKEEKRDEKQRPISLFLKAKLSSEKQKSAQQTASSSGVTPDRKPSTSTTTTPDRKSAGTTDDDDFDLDDICIEELEDAMLVTPVQTKQNSVKFSATGTPLVVIDEEEPFLLDDNDFRDGSQFSMLFNNSPMDFSPICVDSQEDVSPLTTTKSNNPFIKAKQQSSTAQKAPVTPAPNSQGKAKLKLKRKTPSSSLNDSKKTKSSPPEHHPQQSILSFLHPPKPISIKETIDLEGNVVLAIDDE